MGRASGMSPYVSAPSLSQQLPTEQDLVERTLQGDDFEAVFDLYLAACRYTGFGDCGGRRHAKILDNRDAKRVRCRAVELLVQRLDTATASGDPVSLARAVALAARRYGSLGCPESLQKRLSMMSGQVLATFEAGGLRTSEILGLERVLEKGKRERLIKNVKEALEDSSELSMTWLEEVLQEANKYMSDPGAEKDEVLKEMQELLQDVVTSITEEKTIIAQKAELEDSFAVADSTQLRLLNARKRDGNAFAVDRAGSIKRFFYEEEARERAALMTARLARNSISLTREGVAGLLMRRFEGAVQKILEDEAEEAAKRERERRIAEAAQKEKEEEEKRAALEAALKIRRAEAAQKEKEKEEKQAALEAALKARDVVLIRDKLRICRTDQLIMDEEATQARVNPTIPGFLALSEAKLDNILKEDAMKSDLSEALQSRNLEAIKKALAAADKILLRSDPVCVKARSFIKETEIEAEKERRLEAFKQALKSRNLEEIAKAQLSCEAMKIPLAQKDLQAIKTLEDQEKKKVMFQQAVKSGDTNKIKQAIEACGKSRVSLDFMSNTKNMLNEVEEEELRQQFRGLVGHAIKAGDKNILKATMLAADEAGIPERSLGRAKTVLMDFERLDAEDELRKAIQATSGRHTTGKAFEVLERAHMRAKDQGAERGLLIKAEVLIKDLEPKFVDLAALARIDISFEDGKEELVGEQRRAVFQVAHILLKYPDVPVSIHGHRACPEKCKFSHCRDSDFADEYPELSVNRAINVARALQAKGCKNVMLAKGWGCLHQELGNSKRVVRVLPPGVTETDDFTLRTEVRELSSHERAHVKSSPGSSPGTPRFAPITPRSWRSASPRGVPSVVG